MKSTPPYLYGMIAATLLAGFFENAWEHINTWDSYLFLKINDSWGNGFFDAVFPWYRDQNTWIPFYLFLLVFSLINFGWRAWPWILFIVVTAALSDQISSNFVKNFFSRDRPCRDLLLQFYTHLRVGRCPSSGSFTSSHAVNHFAVATFLWLTLKQYIGKWGYLFFFWAATICYGQVYVGVHYPLDVIGGAILGALIGWGTATFFRRRIGLEPKEDPSASEPAAANT